MYAMCDDRSVVFGLKGEPMPTGGGLLSTAFRYAGKHGKPGQNLIRLKYFLNIIVLCLKRFRM